MKIPFIQAKHYTPVSEDHPRKVRLIVIHSMESEEKGETAENVARYFQTTEKPASAHYNIDNNSVVQCVQCKDVAYGAPGANRDGIHLEHAGRAKQTAAQWNDEYSSAMLKLSAEVCAMLCKKFGIPPVWLSPADLAAGKKGLTSHANVTLWQKSLGKPGSHTDPGEGFPVQKYCAMVAEKLKA